MKPVISALWVAVLFQATSSPDCLDPLCVFFFFFKFTSVWMGVNKLKTKKNNSLRAVFNEPSLMLTTCGAVGQI